MQSVNNDEVKMLKREKPIVNIHLNNYLFKQI